MAVKLRKISQNIAEYERFSKIYLVKSSGSLANVAYLQKGDTYVFYRNNAPDEWLGGFCLNTENGFRYLAGFKPTDATALLQEHSLKSVDIIEVGCLWLYSKSISQFERVIFYMLLLIRVLLSGKKIILGGSFIPKVAELHMKILPNLLYDGIVLVAGKQANAKFYYASRTEIPLNFFKGLFFDLSKHFRFTKFLKTSHKGKPQMSIR